MLRQQLNELKKKETTVGDVMAAKMAWFEFPATHRSRQRANRSTAQPCNAKDGSRNLSEKEVAKQNLIERIQRMFAEDERNRGRSCPHANSSLPRSRWPPTQNPAGERSG